MRILLALLLLTALSLIACGEEEHPELRESREIAEEWIMDFPATLNPPIGHHYTGPYAENVPLPDVIFDAPSMQEFREQLPAERRTDLEDQISSFLWKELFRHVSIKITNAEFSKATGGGLITATIAGDMTIDLEEHPPLRIDVSVPILILVGTFIDQILNWAYDEDNIQVVVGQ